MFSSLGRSVPRLLGGCSARQGIVSPPLPRWPLACSRLLTTAPPPPSSPNRVPPRNQPPRPAVVAPGPQRQPKHKKKLKKNPDKGDLKSDEGVYGKDSTAKESKENDLAIALSTAASYDTRVLLEDLRNLGFLDKLRPEGLTAINLLGEAVYIPRWSPSSVDYGGFRPSECGEVFIFESGSIVTWGLSQRGAEAFLMKVIRGDALRGSDTDPTRETGPRWIEHGRYKEVETEVLRWTAGADATRMEGDTIALKERPTSSSLTANGGGALNPEVLARLALSAGMARVTKLGVYEQQFEDFSESVADIPLKLSSGERYKTKRKEITKRLGTLHLFRQRINLEDENLLEEPEFLWEDSSLQSLYNAACGVLEFQARVQILNQRVDYAFQLQETLSDDLNSETSHYLEWIIIFLIAFEIVLGLWGKWDHYVDRWAAEKEAERKRQLEIELASS